MGWEYSDKTNVLQYYVVVVVHYSFLFLLCTLEIDEIMSTRRRKRGRNHYQVFIRKRQVFVGKEDEKDEEGEICNNKGLIIAAPLRIQEPLIKSGNILL